MTITTRVSQNEADPWPNGRNPNQTDPGPPVPGYNCHIVIDGVGYINSDNMDYAQESGKAIGQEATAPFFGDPQNQLDTQSSDLTMLLPIGQNDFTGGIGTLKLEINPKGYERVENLQLTPQNTLLNGPAITTFSLGGSPTDSSRWWQEGYFSGFVRGGTPFDYFAIGSFLYKLNVNTWTLASSGLGPITDLYSYSGWMIVCCGDNVSQLFDGTNPGINVNYHAFKGFTVNGNPFIMYRDGRIYSAFLGNPGAVTLANTETGPDASYRAWSYAVQYCIQLPSTNWIYTRLGPLVFTDKPANFEITITNIPVRGYHGGRVYRKLYRSHDNDSTTLYLIADYTALLDERVAWVDGALDTALTVPYDWTTMNNTAMILLTGGTIDRNMAVPDVSPIWLPESVGTPSSGDYVWKAEVFHDTSGNEAVVIGTTSGLYEWDGASNSHTDLRPSNYNQFNSYSMAINHGKVYFVNARTMAYMWTGQQESFIEGPWYYQYDSVDEIRCVSAGEYVFFSVTGISAYTHTWTVTLYRFNGTVFDWSQSRAFPGYGSSGQAIRPILGKLNSEHSFIWYNNCGESATNKITLDPKYTALQTSNVLFRSALSDCGLPRLRKQVFAVMIRYLQLTPQPYTSLVQGNAGDDFITVTNPAVFVVGDWLAIDSPFPTLQEYRKVSAISGNIITLYHELGTELNYTHDLGVNVYKCAAKVTLRNVFVGTSGAHDIEVGGPYRSDYIFSYIHLPSPVYTYLDGIEIDYNNGTVMELVGWSMLTGLNPAYYGKMDINIRLQDYVKLPNSLFDNATALERRGNLEDAYNKGAVEVVDQFNNTRQMRVQRLSFSYEEPKQRHSETKRNQATAHISLIDLNAELMKQEALVLGIPANQ